MSATAALNMHHHVPPQTYSRLFRPWDHRREEKMNVKSEHCSGGGGGPNGSDSGSGNGESSCVNSSSENNSRRTSQSQTDAMRITIKSERSRSSSSSSSSSCSGVSAKFNYEENYVVRQGETPCFEMAPAKALNLCDTSLSNNATVTSQVIDYLHLQNQYQHSNPQQQALPQLPVPMPVQVPTPPTAMNELYFAASANAAAAAAAASFGMDPYTLGCMEQEYARIIAEEAHLKAMNARKQRPKKFKCPHCDVAFSNNGQLKGHIRIHTGERPFKCDVETCGKTFTRNEELTRHKRIHTGLRPYPCSACGKKFGRRDHLKKHMKTHLPQERQIGAAIFMPMYPYLYGC